MPTRRQRRPDLDDSRVRRDGTDATELARRIIAAVSTTDFRGASGDLRWIADRYDSLKKEPSRERPGSTCSYGEALQRAREEWLVRLLDSV